MNDKTILQAMREGRMFLFVEFRTSEADQMKWTGKKGEAKHANIRKHNLESGSLAFQMTEFLPDDAKPEDFNVPFKKGETIVAEVSSMSMQDGKRRCSGKLHPYVAADSPGVKPLPAKA